MQSLKKIEQSSRKLWQIIWCSYDLDGAQPQRTQYTTTAILQAFLWRKYDIQALKFTLNQCHDGALTCLSQSSQYLIDLMLTPAGTWLYMVPKHNAS
jgi:uncharacterized protein Usg